MKEIIVIVGPTGVGKTKLSIELAKRLNAEVINGDSVAVYKELNIGSAKPTLEEREGIPHHLLDIVTIEDEYSVYDYQKEVRKVIANLQAKNKNIIIVGGTGLYIKAALYDYRFTEGTTNNNYEDLTEKELLERIKAYHVECKEVHNRKRLVRLLNKLENNEEITNYKDNCLYNIKVIGLTTTRDILYERINKRVDIMMDNGLLAEVTGLKEKYKNSRILKSAIGYKEFYDYFYNEVSLTEVLNNIKRDSRRFAKRQYTFFNHQFKTKWFAVDLNNFNNTINDIYKYISKKEAN